MQVDELLRKVQFVTDQSGKKTAVLIDYTFWEELLELLADDNKSVKAFTDTQGDAWITHALNEVCSEEDTSLDPAISAMQRTWLSKEDW